MDQGLGPLLGLVERYGVTLVGLIGALLVIGYLFRLFQSQSDKRIADMTKAHDVLVEELKAQVKYEREQRAEERESRLAAEKRLASNAEALLKATDGFTAAMDVMERQADRLVTRVRPTGNSGK